MGAAVGAGGASSPIMVVVGDRKCDSDGCGGSGDELASGWALLFDFPHVM